MVPNLELKVEGLQYKRGRNTQNKHLHQDHLIGDYALTSALKDCRFDPVSLDEVKHLRVAVSLLVKYEECSDWNVGTHGIIINFHDGTTARNGKPQMYYNCANSANETFILI